MASPQKENGYTPIANEILDAIIASPLRGRELKIVLFILRKTYGHSRKEVKLSYSEIGAALGIKRQAVATLIKTKLSPSKVTAVLAEGDRCKQTYVFNKNYDEWDFNLYPSKSTPPVLAEGYRTVPPEGDSSKILPLYENKKDTPYSPPKKKTPKKTPKPTPKKSLKESYDYPEWLDKELFFKFWDNRAGLKNGKITSDIAVKKLINRLKTWMDAGYSQTDIIEEAITGNWKSFYEPKDAKPEQPTGPSLPRLA